jgi:GNAT superfamily N-acetyltransferase
VKGPGHYTARLLPGAPSGACGIAGASDYNVLSDSGDALAQADIDHRLTTNCSPDGGALQRHLPPEARGGFFQAPVHGPIQHADADRRMDNKPVGFWIGFELKPGMFYHWLGAVMPEVRRHGVGRQLQEAQQAWAKDHGYEYMRCECMNHQREFIHFAMALGYDIVGIRWDSTHADNLIVFEKNLLE